MIDTHILPALSSIIRTLLELTHYIPAAVIMLVAIAFVAGGALLIRDRDKAGIDRYTGHTIAIGYQCADCSGVMIRLCDNSIYCVRCAGYNAMPKTGNRPIICNYCLATRDSDCLVPSCCQKVQRKNK